jgi:divalent metal cation (Fe/Co/Zn/Cd) transporter
MKVKINMPTIASLTTGISFVDLGTALMAIAASLIGVYILWKGARMVIHAVKSL